MNKILNKAGLIILFIALLCICNNVYSQSSFSYDDESFFKIDNPWLNTNNAAALNQYDKSDYFELVSSFNSQNGSFRKSMVAKTNADYNIDILSIKRINNITFLGSFKFKEAFAYDRLWSHLMYSNEDNPYIVGDSINGDYRKELFELKGAISYPLISSKLYGGFSLNYISSMGVKNIDPRPVNLLSELSLSPSIQYALSGKFRLSASYLYASRREDIETKSFNSIQNTLFLFKGLGFVAKQDLVAMFNRLYNKTSNVFELSTQYDDKQFTNFNSIKYSSNSTVIEDGKNIIKNENDYISNDVSLNSLFSFNNDYFSQALVFNCLYKESIGLRNIISKKKTSTYFLWNKYAEKNDYFKKSFAAEIEYRIKNNSWQSNISFSYTKDREEYSFFPERFFQTYSNMLTSCYVKKNIKISKSTLSISANLAYSNNLAKESYLLNESNKLNFNVSELGDFIIYEIAMNDYLVNSSSYFEKGFTLMLNFPLVILKAPIDSFVSINYSNTSTIHFGSRDFLSLSLGMNL